MKIKAYLKYFYYLATNWDVKIAVEIIKQEIKGEKKYNINTTGIDELNDLDELGIDIDHATIYMPASFKLLEECLSKIPTQNKNHFLDIGCGKGRALCVAAHYNFNKVTGIELSKKLCLAAKENLLLTEKIIQGLQSKIINNDAFYFDIPEDVDCIFLFNPFDDVILSGVIDNINESMNECPRTVYIIYFNPIYKDLFIYEGFKEIEYYKKMVYLEASIMVKTFSE
jgi:SAM-dependent methyltransferase